MGVLLHHDNAPTQNSDVAMDDVRNLRYEQVDYPQNSPDMAPSDYILSLNIPKNTLGWKTVSNR